MMNKIGICCLMCLLVLFSSCKRYLDVKPKGNVIPETPEQYAILLHTQLDMIDKGVDETVIGNANTLMQLEFFSDNLDVALSSTINAGTPYYVGAKVNTTQMEYAVAFEKIRDYNVIIGNMADKESALAKKVLGTAYAMRAANYYNLMIRFCPPYETGNAEATLGLPLIDEFNMEAKPARANLKATVDFIAKSLREALSYNVEDKDYLFTTKVVKAYLAKLYFWTQDWDNAIKYADEVLNAYPMVSADRYVAMINSKLTPTENIIIRSYTTDSEDGTFIIASVKSDMVTRPVSKEFVETFTEKGNDIRYPNVINKKRINTKTITANLKSEEMCLILAEAYAHKNDNAQALNYLNRLRSKRITKDYIAYTEANLPNVYPQLIKVDATGKPLSKLISAILCERRKELYMEGDRWFELKRNGRPEFWAPYEGRKYTTQKFLYTYPIYKKDVNLNPGLIIQNEGY
ncbi:RagB/SusD family nutrient uptake outer membrane protein [Pedobacter caeni]|nr:RagB/SusD family nutrient uptake outer membrane protein [Pedobacter caeni]